jgi:hypothetical protein
LDQFVIISLATEILAFFFSTVTFSGNTFIESGNMTYGVHQHLDHVLYFDTIGSGVMTTPPDAGFSHGAVSCWKDLSF